ncbi:MSCRAMM family protein [Marinobacterium nitratireducens]|nr:SpaA isopeptide-forming pilin-related protein [Marinobacterium nitratireducens]
MKCKTWGRRIGACILGAVLGAVPITAAAVHLAVGDSEFEIDLDANFVVDDVAHIDWATASVASAAMVVDDEPTGNDDDSFKGGTKEDTLNPDTTTGSIPNNKSDLLNFGVYQETTDSSDYLHLLWTRVQDPSGTTLMDFEFNAGNSLYPATDEGIQFPVREAGDVLVEYKLAQGGTTPQLFLYFWLESADQPGTCEASNSYPCWGNRQDLTEAGIAVGSINTSVADGSALGLGMFDPYTFGEASIDIGALFPEGECVSFGYASLKSRSSDSFTAQMKDLIAPAPVNISNCANINILKTDDDNPANVVSGAIFRLYNDDGENLGIFDSAASSADPDTRTTVPESDPPVFFADCETDATGKCTWLNVFAGNYCVVEITPPAGHSLPPYPDYFDCGTVSADSDFDVMFTNPRLPARIDIIKTDDATPPNPLAGAEFTLFTDIASGASGAIGSYDPGDLDTGLGCTTNSSGLCSISNILPPGDYCVVETVTPVGHDTADPQCTNLSLDETFEMTFVDPRQPATVNILKKDDDDPANLLSGAEFTLFTDIASGASGAIGSYDPGDLDTGKTCTTDATGTCSITDILPPGKYCIVETITPTGYDTADPQCEDLSLNETVNLEFIDPRQPATVNILKKDDAEPANLLSGAEFTLFTDIASGASGAIDSYDPGDVNTGKSCTTDVSGTCSITDILPPGDYCLVETITPTGYDTAAPQCENLSLNETLNLEFIDPRQPATVNILKKDDADNLLEGAEFTLYSDIGTVGTYDDGVDTSTGKTCTTGADGTCTIDNILPPGDYCLVETVTPDGYETAPPQCENLSLNETVNLDFVDPRKRGAILITKTRKHAADGPGDHPHVGVEFTISGGGLDAPVVRSTDSDGEICVDGLLFSEFFGGDYSVTETLPTGYAADGDLTKTVTVDTVATCSDDPYVGEQVSFSNTPLSDITVSFNSQVPGGTAATISCGLADNPVDNTPAAFDDTSETSVDLLPGTYTCTVVVDP